MVARRRPRIINNYTRSRSSNVSRHLQQITEEHFDYLNNYARLMRRVRQINWIRWNA
jgi:hypothetical protein